MKYILPLLTLSSFAILAGCASDPVSVNANVGNTETQKQNENTEVVVANASSESNTNQEENTNGDLEDTSNDKTTESIYTFDYYLPDEYNNSTWNEAELNILGVEGNIVFGIVEGPVQSKEIYFATSELTPDSNFVRIYEYNYDQQVITKLFSQNFESGDISISGLTENIIPVFHPLGYVIDEQVLKLVLLIQDVNDSPGMCANPILFTNKDFGWENKRQIVTFNFNESNSIEPYVIPEDILKEHEAIAQECENNYVF